MKCRVSVRSPNSIGFHFVAVVVGTLFFSCTSSEFSDETLEVLKNLSNDPDSSRGAMMFPAADGEEIQIGITKPKGEGPFPLIIGVAGGDSSFAFDGSQIGVMSFSFGVAMATGALSRYPDLPVLFLIDWEGPACPGRDIRAAVMLIPNMAIGADWTTVSLHGGNLFDDEYWYERDATRSIRNLPMPYLRIQGEIDHVQGLDKYYMIELMSAVAEAGVWYRCNSHPPESLYSIGNIADYQFFPGNDTAGSGVVLAGYIEEMFFQRPWE